MIKHPFYFKYTARVHMYTPLSISRILSSMKGITWYHTKHPLVSPLQCSLSTAVLLNIWLQCTCNIIRVVIFIQWPLSPANNIRPSKCNIKWDTRKIPRKIDRKKGCRAIDRSLLPINGWLGAFCFASCVTQWGIKYQFETMVWFVCMWVKQAI